MHVKEDDIHYLTSKLFSNYQVRIYRLSKFQYNALFLYINQLNLYYLCEQQGTTNLNLYLIMMKYLNDK